MKFILSRYGPLASDMFIEHQACVLSRLQASILETIELCLDFQTIRLGIEAA